MTKKVQLNMPAGLLARGDAYAAATYTTRTAAITTLLAYALQDARVASLAGEGGGWGHCPQVGGNAPRVTIPRQ